MSDLAVSIILGLVVVGLFIAIVVRNSSVKAFDKKSRAKAFVAYVYDTMKKQPHLHNKHGFFISPELSELVIEELKKRIPDGMVTQKSASITIKLPNSNWIIPICTTEEYTELFV
jgi:hypothetical protein